MRLSVLFAELLHFTVPPTRPTPSLRPRSPPSSTPPEVCLETKEFDIRRGHGTTTTRATFVTQGSLGHDEHALPGRAFLAPAPSRAAAHVATTRKEIRCTRRHPKNKETIKFVNPTRNKIMGSQNMMTCRRRAGGNLHLRAAPDRVAILTVFSGEDAMQWTALLPAQERLFASDAPEFRLDPRPAIRETTKLCFHAFQVPLQRRGGRRNRLRVRPRSRHPGADARRRSSHGHGGCRDWPESEQKTLVWIPHGIAVPMFVAVSVCPRPRPCPRLHP